MDVAIGKNDYIGINMKSILFGYSCSNSNGSKMIFKSNKIFDETAPPTANYPLGPLFNRNINSKVWYENIDELATGLGYPIVSTVANPDYMDVVGNTDMHVIRITKTGNSGISRYDIQVKPIGTDIEHNMPAFNSGQGIHNVRVINPYNTDWKIHDDTTVAPKSILNDDDNDFSGLLKAYNSDKIMMFAPDAGTNDMWIYFKSISDDLYFKAFDTGTNPALLNNGRDLTPEMICRDVSGNVYYASTNKMVKLADPFGSPSVTEIWLASIGLVSEINCIYCNALDRLYVMSDDGISYSDDAGVTWTPTLMDMSSYKSILTSDFTNSEAILVDGSNYKMSWFNLDTNVITSPSSSDGDLGYLVTHSDMCVKTDTVTGLWYIASTKSSGYSTSAYVKAMKFGSVNEPDNVLTIKGCRSMAPGFGSKTGNVYSRMSSIIHLKDNLGNTIIYTTTAGAKPNYVSMEGIRYEGLTTEVTTNGRILNMSDGAKHDDADYYNGVIMAHTLGSIHYGSEYMMAEPQEDIGVTRDIGNSGKVFENLKGVANYYRWDSGAAEWKLNWNKDAVATADGSSSIGANRLNFDTDENHFSGYSSLDLTPTIAGQTFSNGLTIVVKAINTQKDTPAYSSTWRDKASTENPLTCITEIYNQTTGQSIALQQVGYNNTTVILDRTNPSSPSDVFIENAPTIGITNRYAMVVSSDGLTVSVYRNGIMVGSSVSLNTSFSMSDSYDLTIGSRNRCDHQNVRNLGSNFKGNITNIQVFNRAWSSSDVSTDNIDRDGLINNTNLLCRFLMASDYQEGRPTHTSTEETPFGLTVNFPDGDLTNYSYTRNDNYSTIKSKYGLVKDNVTSFDLNTGRSCSSVDFNTCTSPDNGTPISPVADVMLTDRARWDLFTEKFADVEGSSATLGQLHLGSITNEIGITQSSENADWEVEWKFSSWNGTGLFLKFGNRLDLDKTYRYYTVDSPTLKKILFNKAGVDTITMDGQTINHVIETGDRFKIAYTHATQQVGLYAWNDVTLVWDQVGVNIQMVMPATCHVSAYFSIYGSTPIYTGTNPNCSIQDVMVTYKNPKELFVIGDKANKTGGYAFDFSSCDPAGIGAGSGMKVFADGVELSVTNSHIAIPYNGDGILGGVSGIAQGSCIFYPTAGMILISTADVGKVITVKDVSTMLLGVPTPVDW